MAIVINGSGTVTGISVGGLPDDIIDSGTLADNAVGLAQMAGGTDGNIITYDTSGNPAVVATGSDGQVLTSAGADAVPAFEAAASGTNTPSFLVRNPSNTEIADATYVKIQLQTEVFDTDTCYDNSSNYRFTPDVAGKYFFFGATQTQETEDYNDAFTMIYKNGSQAFFSNSPHLHYHTNQVSGVIDMNGSSDYVELYMHNNTGGGTTTITTSAGTTYFGGFRLL